MRQGFRPRPRREWRWACGPRSAAPQLCWETSDGCIRRMKPSVLVSGGTNAATSTQPTTPSREPSTQSEWVWVAPRPHCSSNRRTAPSVPRSICSELFWRVGTAPKVARASKSAPPNGAIPGIHLPKWVCLAQPRPRCCPIDALLGRNFPQQHRHPTLRSPLPSKIANAPTTSKPTNAIPRPSHPNTHLTPPLHQPKALPTCTSRTWT